MSNPVVQFATSANAAVVSPYSLGVIRGILQASSCPSCTITSTSRTPAQQARAMYTNIVNLGVQEQLALYAPAGDAVINACVAARKAGLPPVSVIAAMTAKVIEVGPSNVSLHCADPTRTNIVNIAPSSVVDPGAFLSAIKTATAEGKLSRYFSPGSHDPAFHIEIPQP